MCAMYLLMNPVAQALQSTCFIGRIAGIELQVAHDIHKKPDLQELENNAGIHITSRESLQAYVTQLLTAYDHCTHIAEWEKTGAVYAITGRGQELIAKRTPHIPKIPARQLEPYYEHPSWMPVMKGKRILVVHPFDLESRVPHLSNIFPNRSWLEDCTFTFVKPPLTLAGNHGGKDWQIHLSEFLPKLEGKEFDVALVAAGGYGMLIADHIYTHLHKSVMYIGGALQLFFGVIGKRWFDNPDIVKLVNDSWIRPALSEQPPNYKKVEKGCYW